MQVLRCLYPYIDIYSSSFPQNLKISEKPERELETTVDRHRCDSSLNIDLSTFQRNLSFVMAVSFWPYWYLDMNICC